MVSVVGSELSMTDVVNSMVHGNRSWKAVSAFGGSAIGVNESAKQIKIKRVRLFF